MTELICNSGSSAGRKDVMIYPVRMQPCIGVHSPHEAYNASKNVVCNAFKRQQGLGCCWVTACAIIPRQDPMHPHHGMERMNLAGTKMLHCHLHAKLGFNQLIANHILLFVLAVELKNWSSNVTWANAPQCSFSPA